MRYRLVVILALGACGRDVGPPGEWIPVEAIDGELRPELRLDPPPLRARRAVPADPLRVASYNVEYGDDPEALAEAILDDPDLSTAGLLLVQEEEWHPGEGASRAARLAALLAMAHVYVPARRKGDGTHGLAILSAFPIENVRKMELPRVNLDVSDAQRIAVEADIRVGDRTLHVIDVHLDTILNVTDRILQLRPAVIDAPDTVLVAGDFNTNHFAWADPALPDVPAYTIADTDQAPVLDEYVRALGFDTPTAALGPTARGALQEFRLDSIFTRGLEIQPGAVVRRIDLSDHWPLWVDVTLP